jgi:hypothetical protein
MHSNIAGSRLVWTSSAGEGRDVAPQGKRGDYVFTLGRHFSTAIAVVAMRRREQNLCGWALLMASLIVVEMPVFAQLTSGNLAGTIYDPTGAAVPGA